MIEVKFSGSVEEVKMEMLEFVGVFRGHEKSPTVEEVSKVKFPKEAEPKKEVESPKVESPAPTSVVPTVPTVATQYEVADLQRFGAELLRKDKSKREALLGVLESYGVKAVTELANEHYGAYVQKLKALGADV